MGALTKLGWQKALRGAELTHAEFRILTTIGTYTNAALSSAFPGRTKIMEDARVSERTLDRALKILVAEGWITLVEAGGNQHFRGKANVYAVSVPDIAKGGNLDGKVRNHDGKSPRTIADPSGHTHQVIDHSADNASGSPQAQLLAKFDTFLEHNDLTLDEQSTALGMFENGSDLNAIRNKINSDRRSTVTAPTPSQARSVPQDDPWGTFDREKTKLSSSTPTNGHKGGAHRERDQPATRARNTPTSNLHIRRGSNGSSTDRTPQRQSPSR